MGRSGFRGSTTRATAAMAVAVAVAAVLVGCGGDDKATSPATTAAPPTTAKNSATSAPTTSAAVSPVSATDLPKGPTYKTSSGPSGSGCTPPSGTSLPSGWWAGEIKKVDGTALDLDLVCYFTGDAAIKAAKDDKKPAPTDIAYIRNENPTTFRETFASRSVPATCVGDSNQSFTCSVGTLLDLYAGSGVTASVGGREVTRFPIVWVHVDKGGADYIFQQFQP